jgi:hypothetical protein
MSRQARIFQLAAALLGLAAICLFSASTAAAGEDAAPLLDRAAVGVLKFGVAACTTALLFWGIALRRRRRRQAVPRWHGALLLVLGIAGAAGWWNFLEFRYQPGFGHPLDVYHYYIGAKYFDELGYTRLYECTTVADSEAGAHELAARRSIRNLETYERESAAGILADPTRCTRHFAPERWELFEHDVGWFRERIPEGLWQGALSDFGYNPSPAWGAVASPFISAGPVSEANLAPVLLVDPLLLLAMWSCVWRAFGWRAACVALVFWGTNLPGDYLWTGGAFLRQTWLASLVIGICCLRVGRPAAGGFLLSVAALLRVFPAVTIAAVVAATALAAWRRGSAEPTREQLRFVAGCAAAVIALVPLSFATAGGPGAWLDFAGNIRFHADTPFATNVGLQNFLAYTGAPSFLSVAILIGYAALLLRAVDRKELWEAAAVGTGAVVLLASMSSYYYGVLLGFAFLSTRRESVGALLCALAAAGWCLEWSTARTDVVYVWLSLATVLFVLIATALMARPFAPETEAPPAA